MATYWLVLSIAMLVGGSGLAVFLASVVYAARGKTEESFIGGGLVLLCIGCLPLLILVGQYQSCLSLEARIPALERIIEQQSNLLSKNPTLGEGLEGLETKRIIMEKISALNELIAMGQVRIASPWWYFKPAPVWEQ